MSRVFEKFKMLGTGSKLVSCVTQMTTQQKKNQLFYEVILNLPEKRSHSVIRVANVADCGMKIMQRKHDKCDLEEQSHSLL